MLNVALTVPPIAMALAYAAITIQANTASLVSNQHYEGKL